MATNSSPKKKLKSKAVSAGNARAEAAFAISAVFSLTQVKEILVGLGQNPALPCAIFDHEKKLVGVNARMKEMLALDSPLPLGYKTIENQWPFFNEFEAGPKILAKLLSSQDLKNEGTMVAQSHLKTYRLVTVDSWNRRKKSRNEAVLDGNYRIIVAQVVRSGDLLKDRKSRQELFRAISHEIRTSLMALNGYVNMLQEESKGRKSQAMVERVATSMERLNQVVKRLEDFRTELEA